MVDECSLKTEIIYRDLIDKFLYEIKKELNNDEDLEELKELKNVTFVYSFIFNNIILYSFGYQKWLVKECLFVKL